MRSGLPRIPRPRIAPKSKYQKDSLDRFVRVVPRRLEMVRSAIDNLMKATKRDHYQLTDRQAAVVVKAVETYAQELREIYEKQAIREQAASAKAGVEDTS